MLVFWLRPVTLARLGGSRTLDELGEATQRAHWLQPVIRIGTRLVFNPWITTRRRVRIAWIKAYQNKTEGFAELGSTVRTDFLDHPDVLDAWVERRAASIQGALDHFDLFLQRRLYVALPIRMGEPATGELVEQPSAESFRPLFEGERVVLPIVGVGGSLLRSKRLLVIIDALSERDAATQEHVCQVYQSGLPLNALIVTTRRPPNFGAVDRTEIHTERITVKSLIPFIFEYLRRRQLHGEFEEREQLQLGDRVLALVQASGRTLNVTPLLVTLFVDSALARSRAHRSLEELPTSVPEVYLDYLRRLNPKQGGIPHAIDDQTILDAARIMARTRLAENFVPGDVRRDAVEAALAEKGLGFEPRQLIDRLIGNGVVEQFEMGAIALLRFALDPVAEYLAAIEAVHELGRDPRAWHDAFAVLQEVDGYPEAISGFLNALGDCYATYRKPFHLPDLELPWQPDEAAREAA